MHRAPFPAIGLTLFASLVASPVQSQELKDLYFGEALYYAHQDYYFEALERLDSEMLQHREVDEPDRDTLYFHLDEAQFSLGDFELRYRMHHRAGRAIRAVLEGAVDENVRNDAAYRLARIHFQKGQIDEAQLALDRISGKVPERIKDDIAFLRANLYLARKQPAEAALVFERLQNSDEFSAFAAYNMGIAYLQDGQRKAAISQLDRAGQIAGSDDATLALRDKSNLVLGTLYLEEENYRDAAVFFNRVRLDGPYSNQALLSAGWAHVSSGNYADAVVPWNILADREVTDRATQEAMLALPYAYANLDVHGRAATNYGRALDSFGAEANKLNESIESIRSGNFLKALIREEIRQNKDWVIRLRTLPEAPETFYLDELLASHDFQTGLQNYLDLADLKRKLESWQKSFDSFDEMVEIRRAHYEPLLPAIDTEFRELDSRMRLRVEQYKMLMKRRDDLLTTPRPEFLATPDERFLLGQLGQLESQASGHAPSLERVARLKGVIIWSIETQYHDRFTEFDGNLRSLGESMTYAQAEYDEFVRARQAATHSYVGYENPVKRLRMQVRESIDRIDVLMARQGHELEVAAIDELVARRDRLDSYRDKARFALADSYDRATQAQASREEP